MRGYTMINEIELTLAQIEKLIAESEIAQQLLANGESQQIVRNYVKQSPNDTVYFSVDRANILKSGSEKNDMIFSGVACIEKQNYNDGIVRIGGISFGRHSNNSPLPIVPNHLSTLQNGEPATLGKVTKLEKSNVDGTPVLLFEAEWANKDGEVIGLAKKWKEMTEATSGITDVSIGAKVKEVKIIKNSSDEFEAFDYVSTTLLHISLVEQGADMHAVLRSHMQNVSELEDDRKVEQENKNYEIIEEIRELKNNIVEKMDELQLRMDEISSDFAGLEVIQSQKSPAPKVDSGKIDPELTDAINELISKFKNTE